MAPAPSIGIQLDLEWIGFVSTPSRLIELEEVEGRRETTQMMEKEQRAKESETENHM